MIVNIYILHMSSENNSQDDVNTRLFNSYESKLSSLQKSFLLEIGFGLFFFLMILLPYFSLKYDTHDLSPVSKIREDIPKVSGEFENAINYILNTNNIISQSLNDTDKATKEASSYYRELETFRYLTNQSKFIPDIVKEKLTEIQVFPECSKFPIISRNWTICNYNKKSGDIKPIIDEASIRRTRATNELSTKLNKTMFDINSFAKNIKNASFQLKPYLKNVKLLLSDVNNTLLSARTNLEAVGKALPVNDSFSSTIPVAQLGIISNDLESSKNELQQEKTNLQRIWDNIDNSTKKLSTGLEQIETPVLGRLPIRFEEAIATFPVGLSIGFLVCCALLSQSISLRSSIHNVYKYPDVNIDIASLAPVWIEPTSKKLTQITQLIMFSSPFLIFAISVAIIFDIWFVIGDDIFRFAPNLNRPLYLALYIASFIPYIIGILLIIKAIRNYLFCCICKIKFENRCDFDVHKGIHRSNMV
jgi:hypothetical protein